MWLGILPRLLLWRLLCLLAPTGALTGPTGTTPRDATTMATLANGARAATQLTGAWEATEATTDIATEANGDTLE